MTDTSSAQRLLAILAADAAGYTRLMASDAAAALASLQAARTVFRREVESNGGRIVDTAGDSVLAAFPAAAAALAAALGVQSALGAGTSTAASSASASASPPSDRRLPFRIGVHLGDVSEAVDGSIYGDGVNVAARLQQLAPAGGIVVSQALHDAALGRIDVRFDDLGLQRLKGVDQALRAYRIATGFEVERPAQAPVEDDATAPEAALASIAPPAVRTHLPSTLTPLIGRSDDLAALHALVDRHRLVTVCAAGGMGKTLLAQHLLQSRANRYAHGISWIELGATREGDELPALVAARLDVKLGSGEPLDALARAVAPLDLLVVLDNAEQVLEAVAALVQRLLDAAPLLTLVVTSQVPLKLAAERVYRIDALSVPHGELPLDEALAFGAVALFAERARQADSRFALTAGNVAGVIEICRALDGVALAIELAAARAPTVGVARIAASMEERLRMLTTSRNRSAPARQQTLRAALEWSWGLLDERDRTVLRRLAVMVGSFDVELAQKVAADERIDEWAVLDAIEALVDRSLVHMLADAVAGADADGAAPARYRLLDSPRAYAREQLVAAGEADAMAERHAEAMGERCDAALRDFASNFVIQSRLAADLDNARVAAAWARAARRDELFVRVAVSLIAALDGVHVAERDELGDACEACAGPDLQPLLRARALDASAFVDSNRSVVRSAAKSVRAVAAAREAGDPRWLAKTLSRLVISDSGGGDLERLPTAMAELQTLIDPAWPEARLRLSALAAGEAAVFMLQGRHPEALAAKRREVALMSQTGEAGALAPLTSLLDLEVQFGDYDGAIRDGSLLLARYRGSRHAYPIAFMRLNTCSAWCLKGGFAEARELIALGWDDAVRFGHSAWWADYLALVVASEGNAVDAARIAGYADATYRRNEDQRQPNEAMAVDRAREIAEQSLGADETRRLVVEGGSLVDADIRRFVFA